MQENMIFYKQQWFFFNDRSHQIMNALHNISCFCALSLKKKIMSITLMVLTKVKGLSKHSKCEHTDYDWT